jgi:DNA-binding NarL/FixJ family response regulator
MDIRMPRMDGVEATRRICGGDPTRTWPRVIVLTTFDLDEYVAGALSAGASGFLLKDAPPADILAGIRVVTAGDALLGSLRNAAAARPVRHPPAGHQPGTAARTGPSDRP